MNSISPPLESGLDMYLLRPIEYSRSSSVPVTSLGLGRPGTFPLALLWLLLLRCGHKNVPGAACWKVRHRNRAETIGHPGQGQSKPETLRVCKNPAKISRAQPVSAESHTHVSPSNAHWCMPLRLRSHVLQHCVTIGNPGRWVTAAMEREAGVQLRLPIISPPQCGGESSEFMLLPLVSPLSLPGKQSWPLRADKVAEVLR